MLPLHAAACGCSVYGGMRAGSSVSNARLCRVVGVAHASCEPPAPRSFVYSWYAMRQCGTGLDSVVQAWHDSFNPDENPTARELVREWRQRLDRSQSRSGQLYFQYHTVFDAIVRARMGRAGEAIWTADQCAPGSCGALCPTFFFFFW